MTGFSSILPFAICLFTCTQDQGMRDIIPEEFVKSRPARSIAPWAPARRVRYKPAATSPEASTVARKPGSSNALQLGLTIWRLRPSSMTESGARIIVHHDGETEEWTPELIESNTPLRMGERIRFSFESPQTGYLYVIEIGRAHV